ncbi:MFS transporter [Janibacter massiliensis]|uniref:MFS transporter n=1 Tax=Janibacter massiliensis TaxID=2058291 RepID=UPI002D77BB80|nr:MFS transporter [Janibacter massiliensis]
MSGPAASEARVGPVSPIATEAPGAPARRWRRSWYWYDWANSAFVTTTGTVLFGPYLTAVATEDACPGLAEDATCGTDLRVLGVPVDPGSVAAYTVTVATIVSAILLVFVGALADRSPRPARLLGGFAWTGALAAALMVLVTGSAWELGAILMIVATVALGASLVVYDALLCRIAHPDDRDAVSSRGWALGYLGGGLLLVANLALVSLTPFGLSTGDAVRLCLLSAGLWWAAFTLIPVVGLRRVRGLGRAAPGTGRGIVRGSLGQLRDTFIDLRRYPQTMSFLAAYLFFNDGIQTVIAASAIYAVEEIGFAESQLMALILVVQFVAFGGALLFGLIAARAGAKRTVLGGIGLWTGVVVAAYLLPNGRFLPFVALGVVIGVVLGGTQALSRSLYSQLVPADREAEYFSLYQAMERGTSWFGMLTFGLVHQLTGSYRLAIIALIVFFVVGGVLLARVDVRRGIREAGNEVPAVA